MNETNRENIARILDGMERRLQEMPRFPQRRVITVPELSAYDLIRLVREELNLK